MNTEEMEARIKTLEEKVRTFEDIRDIERLQRAYGYYLEHWMSQEIIDLFADGPDVSLMLGAGTYLGKEGVTRYFNGNDGTNPEFFHQVMQLSGIVDVNPDGKSAEGRWYGWGVVAMPSGGGVRQLFMGGIYVCVYVKENGIWKIQKLRFDMHYTSVPEKGWVSPERLAAATKPDQTRTGSVKVDIPRTFQPRYPSGYILPFHYKHPVTGKETSEAKRNANVKGANT